MDTLQEQLDRSFGDGPPLPTVASQVAAGRRALMRRRMASRDRRPRSECGAGHELVRRLARSRPAPSGWPADPTSSATPSAPETTDDP